jgi:Dyp-type peroxidase family
MHASDLLQVQGNVLVAFPQDHQIFLFLNFGRARDLKSWLTSVSEEVTLTSDLCGPDATAQGNAVCRSIGLTAPGVMVLSQVVGRTFSPFVAYYRGASARAAFLRDDGPSAPERWVFGGPTSPVIHAVLLLAATHAALLESEAARQIVRAQESGIDIAYRQDCSKLTGALSDCEHFGFRDGISQPILWHKNDVDLSSDAALPVGEFVLGHPRADLATRDCPSWMRNGSFQVIRRLRQDVASWRRQIDRLWHELGESEALSREVIAAKLVGRWASGTPLATAPEKDTGGSPEAQFDFADDPEGFVTPRFSHIRKMLPRVSGFPERRWRRIIRRGVPFGPPYDDAPEQSDRGLLFNAYMANIEEQFEFLIRSWANDPDFAEAGDGPDPVIGRAAAPVTLRQRGKSSCPLQLGDHVTTTGNVYLFVPAGPALRLLVG